MKKIVTLSFVLSMLVSASALASQFTIDPSHSNVDFTIRHLVSKVKGNFTDFSGGFAFDEKKGAKLENVTFSIKTASINTANAKRDEHLKSGDFFDAAKYPTIDFTGKKVSAAGKNKFKVDGDLTMHGVTKPVTINVEYLGTSPSPFGGNVAGFVATTKLKRKDFGISWNKALDTGSMMLGDDVDVQINVEAGAKAEESAKH